LSGDFNRDILKGFSMKTKAKVLFCVLSLIFSIFCAQVYAKSPVWKVSKDGYHLFLGGTIHLLTESDYPLPAEFETAYNNSLILVFETDLQKLGSPQFQQKLFNSTMYAGDQNITPFLTPDTKQALETYLENRGIPMASVLKFKPGMLSITLTVVELQRLGLAGTGVDEFFNAKALNDSKKIIFLETVYDQLEFLSKMGEGRENELIEYTLNDLNDLPKIFASMKEAWRNGDNAQLQEIGLAPWKDSFPELYHALLVERNNNWIPQIERMLTTKEVEFVLFGALHLAGEQGILTQLEALGYKIENQ